MAAAPENARKTGRDPAPALARRAPGCVVATAGRHGLILDETYFYPTSGGQPHDTGRLNGIPVVDVTLREDDDAIVLVRERCCTRGRVSGQP